MLENIASSSARISRNESIERRVMAETTPPYDLGLRENIIDDLSRIKRFAVAYKQQYVWGKFGKSCGLSIQQANDVFDTSLMKIGYDAQRVVTVVVFLAKNAPIRDSIPFVRPRQVKANAAQNLV